MKLSAKSEIQSHTLAKPVAIIKRTDSLQKQDSPACLSGSTLNNSPSEVCVSEAKHDLMKNPIGLSQQQNYIYKDNAFPNLARSPAQT